MNQRKHELDRLRSKAGVADPGCPECEEANDKVEVYWDASSASTTYEGPDFCPACGRRLVIDIYWPVEEHG